MIRAFCEFNSGFERQFQQRGILWLAGEEFRVDPDSAAEGSEAGTEIVAADNDDGFRKFGELQKVVGAVDISLDQRERQECSTHAGGHNGLFGIQQGVWLTIAAIDSDPAWSEEAGFTAEGVHTDIPEGCELFSDFGIDGAPEESLQECW